MRRNPSRAAATGTTRPGVNRPSSAKRNVSHHYDIGNELYKHMLDSEHMQYSCAYWPREGMTLGEAQEAKLAQLGGRRHVRRQHLHRDAAPEPGVLRAIDLAHSAGTEGRLDLVRSQPGTALERHLGSLWGDSMRRRRDSPLSAGHL